MLIYELEEQKALKDFVEREPETSEALEKFLLTHYATPHPQAEYLSRIVKNLVGVTGSYYLSLPKDKKLSFLKCITSVFKLVFAMKIWESRFSAVDAAQQLLDKPLFFASLTELIEPLESLQKGLQEIDAELPIRRVLLVEGDTEANFVRTIQLSSTVLNFDFSMYVYGGKGAINSLVHYIRERNRQGIRVDLSYDSDGQTASFLDKLKRSCAIQNCFGFRRDFEGAFPPDLLQAALSEYLHRYARVEGIVTESVVASLLANQKPFALAFEEKFDISICKPKLGIVLAETVLQNGAVWDGVVDTSSQCSEIARFLRFLMLW